MVALSLPISFPKFVTDKVVLQEIVYQTYIHGIGATLAKAKKATWPPLPLIVRAYRMVHAKDADKVHKYIFITPLLITVNGVFSPSASSLHLIS